MKFSEISGKKIKNLENSNIKKFKIVQNLNL